MPVVQRHNGAPKAPKVLQDLPAGRKDLQDRRERLARKATVGLRVHGAKWG